MQSAEQCWRSTTKLCLFIHTICYLSCLSQLHTAAEWRPVLTIWQSCSFPMLQSKHIFFFFFNWTADKRAVQHQSDVRLKMRFLDVLLHPLSTGLLAKCKLWLSAIPTNSFVKTSFSITPALYCNSAKYVQAKPNHQGVRNYQFTLNCEMVALLRRILTEDLRKLVAFQVKVKCSHLRFLKLTKVDSEVFLPPVPGKELKAGRCWTGRLSSRRTDRSGHLSGSLAPPIADRKISAGNPTQEFPCTQEWRKTNPWLVFTATAGPGHRNHPRPDGLNHACTYAYAWRQVISNELPLCHAFQCQYSTGLGRKSLTTPLIKHSWIISL